MNNMDEKGFKDAIRKFGKEFEQLEKCVLLCCGVTFTQCNTILEIGRAGSVSLNKLADLLEVDNSTMSQTISKLVKQKLVKREVDPDDRRYVTISLTQEGMTVYKKLDEGMSSYYTDVYHSIPEDKRVPIIDALSMMTDILRQKR